MILLALVVLLGACAAPAPTPLPEMQKPTVELAQVQVASYFPWGAPAPTVGPSTPTPAPTPAIRVPLILAFVFDVKNPNPYPVTLDTGGMRFTVEFEVPGKGAYFPVNTPIVNERMSVPGGATNQLRVTMVLDSLIVPGNLAVTSGAKLKELGVSGAAVVQEWFEKVGDFSYGIKVTGGSAEFKSDKGSAIVTFTGQWPKK
jgi:hypothetical protein